MHGIHPCKDGTLRGNLVFQKLDVVATILQIQCPSAGGGGPPSGCSFSATPLAINCKIFLLHHATSLALPIHAASSQSPRFVNCFRYADTDLRFYRVTSCRHVLHRNLPISTPPLAWLTASQGRRWP